MTIEELMDVIRAKPFQPFRVYMADDRNMRVKHPEFVARSPLGRSLMVYKDDGPTERMDLRLVTSMEPVNGDAA